jgi:hypothetical protein
MLLQQSAAATLASVKEEMAKPRFVESARRGADTFANGGHIAVLTHDETFRRVEMTRILLHLGRKR